VPKRNIRFVDEDRDRRFLKNLPKGIRKAIGNELHRLQNGGATDALQQWRPLEGFGKGIGELKRGGIRVVLSVVVDPISVWIVCAFKKDAKKGAQMPRKHRTLIYSSLKKLEEIRVSECSPVKRRH
jgi:phage-related protein